MKANLVVSLLPASVSLRVLIRLFDQRVISEADLSAALARHEARWAPKLGLA